MNMYRSSTARSTWRQILVCVFSALLSGCSGAQSGTVTPASATMEPDPSLVVNTPGSLLSTLRPTDVPQATTPMPPTVTVTRETKDPLVFSSALLVQVHEQADGRPRQEVWILEPGHSAPRSLLANDKYSFDLPIWSHDGEWISYRQRDLASNQYQVGIVRKSGIEQHLVASQAFARVSAPLWSWDDRLLIFTVDDATGKHGLLVDIQAGLDRVFSLDGTSNYDRLILLPSPVDSRILYATLGAATSERRVTLGIVTSDAPEKLEPINAEKWPACSWFTAIKWSPDGRFFLVEPGNDDPQPTCAPSIWKYTLENQMWQQVATVPGPEPHFLYLKLIDWSPDGRWVLWKETDRIVVLDSSEWRAVQLVELGPNQIWLTNSFIDDSAGDSHIAIAEFDYSQPPKGYRLIAMDPADTSQTERMVAQLLREPDWLPAGFDYVPIAWEP